MKPKLLHLMRHGEPQQSGLLLGFTDTPSTDAGIEACIARAAGLKIRALICSDLARACVPARKIAALYGVPLHIDPRWREMDFGAWDGAVPADIAADALNAFRNDPVTNVPPEGESWLHLLARVAEALADMPHSALVIAHAGSIRAAICHLLGLSYQQAWTIDLPYNALLSMKIWSGNGASMAQITGLRT